MDNQQEHPDKFTALYQLAEPQAGYFTTTQALAAGFSHRQLSYYASTGRFLRIRRGIYRLAHFPHSPHEDLFIAWLRVGKGAVISHESALALYELSDILPTETHLIVPPGTSRRHPGLQLHTNRLQPGDITMYAGLPVTTVSRTLAHVTAAGLADELVIQAVHEAVQRGLVTKRCLLNMADQQGGRIQRLVQTALEGMATW